VANTAQAGRRSLALNDKLFFRLSRLSDLSLLLSARVRVMNIKTTDVEDYSVISHHLVLVFVSPLRESTLLGVDGNYLL
jgi:hypothetical protein